MSKPLQILIVLLGSLFAVYLGASLSSGDVMSMMLIVVVLLPIVMGMLLARGTASTAYLLAICISGYFVAGKGFAYLAPFPPLFVGELVLAITGIIYITRIATKTVSKGIPDPFLTFTILLAIIYAGIQLIVNISEYGLNAVRDFSTFYYAAFLFIAYDAFAEKSVRNKFLSVCFIAGIIGTLTLSISFTDLSWMEIIPFKLRGNPIFLPHEDTRVPIVAALVVLLIIYKSRSIPLEIISWIGACALIAFIISYTKSAYSLGIFSAVLFAAFAGKISRIWKFSLLCFLFGIIAIGAVLTIEGPFQERIEHITDELESLNPENFLGSYAGNSGTTTEWRLVWWKKIVSEVNAKNPAFGLGLGSDISSFFFDSYYGPVASAVEEDGGFARYPHNILFTVLGRLGYVGLMIWLAVMCAILRLAWTAAKLGRSSKFGTKEVVTWSFVIAGLANSLVQSTFEAPYAAIAFWCFLGCAIRMLEQAQPQKISDLSHHSTLNSVLN